MRLGTTVLLLLIVCGLGAFIFLKERHLETTREIATVSDLALEFEKSEITAIHLHSMRSKISLEREGEGERKVWRAVGDLEDRADGAWVDSLLEAAAGLQIIERIGREEIEEGDFDLAGCGLDRAATTLVLERADGSQAAVEIGSAGALEGTVHLRRAGEEFPVLLVRSPIRDFSHEDLSALRDRLLWEGDPAAVLGFVYSGKHGEVAFERPTPEDYWQIVRPLQTAANDDLLTRLLAMVSKTVALEFLESEGPPPSDPVDPTETITLILQESLDGAAPARTLTFWKELPGAVPPAVVVASPSGSPAPEPSVAPDQPAIYARSSDRSAVLRVDPRTWEAIDLEINDLRNRTLARLNAEAIGLIGIEGVGTAPVDLRRENGAWNLHRNGRRARANEKRIKRLFKAINEHEIIDFVSDSASHLEDYGLDQPFLKVRLQTTAEGPAETLLLGGKRGTPAINAHWEGDPFIYQVSPELLPEIPVEPVRWKDLTVLQFSIFSLRSLRISAGVSPPLSLDYDYRYARWSAERAGEDITDLLDPILAEEIADRLGTLRVSDWAADAASGFAALREPSLVVDLALQRTELDGSVGETVAFQLSFAPVGSGPAGTATLHYGTVKGIPEVFLIRSEIVRLLSTPPLKRR